MKKIVSISIVSLVVTIILISSIHATAATQLGISILQCETDPVSGKQQNCTCIIDETRNKLAVVIKKQGIYDTTSVRNAILQYTKAASRNVGVVNGRIVKFEGSTINELEELMDRLYTERNIAYVVLVGDDLPVAQDVFSVQAQLETVSGEYSDAERKCREMAISYVLPPISNPFIGKESTGPKIEKRTFIEQIFKTYAKYHRKPESYFEKYKGFLRIEHDPALSKSFGEPIPLPPLGYSLPTTEVLNSNHQEIQSQLKQKHLLLRFDVHGAVDIIGMGLNLSGLSDEDYGSIYTSLEEYGNFVKMNGLPALFVDSGSCQATTISAPGVNLCCWPQMFFRSGVWAYYTLGGSGIEKLNIEKALEGGETFGYLLRKMPHGQFYIYGDVVAHFPAALQNN